MRALRRKRGEDSPSLVDHLARTRIALAGLPCHTSSDDRVEVQAGDDPVELEARRQEPVERQDRFAVPKLEVV